MMGSPVWAGHQTEGTCNVRDRRTAAFDIPVLGMTCEVRRARRTDFEASPGALDAQANLATERAHVRVIDGITTPQALIAAIEDAVYHADQAGADHRTTSPRVGVSWRPCGI
jgi:hypothetical protein